MRSRKAVIRAGARRGCAPDTALRTSPGFTLVEVIIALVVLSVGILVIASVFSTGSRSQVQSRMESTAGQYADEEFEVLRGLARNDVLLAAGRHPSTDYDSLGVNRAWRRYYVITPMSSPLDSLLKVQTVVIWRAQDLDSVAMTGYLNP